MFNNAESFNQPLNNWNINYGTDMDKMFNNTSMSELSEWYIEN